MEEFELEDRPGFFSKVTSRLRLQRNADEEAYEQPPTNHLRLSATQRYSVTVRRQIVSFQDAVAAADGLKRGEQQILNLCGAEPVLREKIIHFMCGVNYAEEGTWEEVGDFVFLLAPPQATVDVAPSSPRMAAARN